MRVCVWCAAMDCEPIQGVFLCIHLIGSIATFSSIKCNPLHNDILSYYGNATKAAETTGEKRNEQEGYRQKDRKEKTID